MGIDRAPVEGDVVCDEFGMTHTLGRRLGEGGEGIVYDAGNGMVAKIYHADKCDPPGGKVPPSRLASDPPQRACARRSACSFPTASSRAA